MNPRDALHLQLRLEGNEIVRGDRLRQVETVPGEELPLVLVAQLADGELVAYYNEALQAEFYTELSRRIHKVCFPEIEPLLDFFKRHGLSVNIGHFKTYLSFAVADDSVNDQVKCLSRNNSLVKEFGFDKFAEEVYCVKQAGRVVAACVSVRQDERCAEAWVYSDPLYRRQGLAQQVIKAWAREMRKRGKVPFYSHALQNLASANLAHRLGLQPLFEEIVISRSSSLVPE